MWAGVSGATVWVESDQPAGRAVFLPRFGWRLASGDLDGHALEQARAVAEDAWRRDGYAICGGLPGEAERCARLTARRRSAAA